MSATPASTERHDYFRSTILIGSLTALSRLLGLVRDVACAAVFGGGVVWDAFSFAWRVPNLFRALFGEGALSAAVIPVFTEYLELRGRKEAWRLAWVVLTATSLILGICMLIGEGVVLVVGNLPQLNERWRLALVLTAVLVPYMLFICLAVLVGAFQNCLRHFSTPALNPVVLNVCWIVAIVVVAPLIASSTIGRAFVLAVGILASGIFQLLLQAVMLRRQGFPWEPVFDLRHPGLRRIAAVMTPIVIGMTVFEINVLLDGVIAISFSGSEPGQTFSLFGAQIEYPMLAGANSALYYANRLMQFPLGVFGIALGTAVFPTLSACAARQDRQGFSGAVTDGLGAVLFIAIPAGAGLIVLGRPIIELLFEHKQFTSDMSALTAQVLAAYCMGLWAYCSMHVLTRSFYSLQDSKTPVKVAVCMVALNLTLNLTLIWPLGAAGLAFATAISSSLQCVLLYTILRRKAGLSGQGRLLATLGKTALATAVMVLVCLVVLSLLPPAPAADDLAVKAARALVPVAAGGVAYLAAAALLRVPEMALLTSALRRRLRRNQAG